MPAQLLEKDYKVVGNCVHKYDKATKTVGKVVEGGCHDTHEEAARHARALYANVKDVSKEVAMSSSRKNRANNRKIRSSKVVPEEVLKAQEEAEDEALLELEEDEPLSEDEQALLDEEEGDSIAKELSEAEEVEKDYYGASGATSWEQVDQLQVVREQTEQLRKAAMTAEDLVYNILYAPDMTPEKKAVAIKSVADGFGERATQSVKMEKEIDFDLLELEAIIAQDDRNITLKEQVGDWLSKAKLSYAAKKALGDSSYALVTTYQGKKIRKYVISDAAHVRNALARAAQQIKRGIAPFAGWARAALPKIRAAAKKFGIGQMKKEIGGLWVEKDAKGDWRWLGWPSNKWKDREGEILRESAHEEYAEWVNKDIANRAPAFASWHVPGSAREYPVDYVGYIDGFLVMSGKLTDGEAQGLLELQKETDLGLSLGGIYWKDVDENNVANHYICHEVSDLPLEKAAALSTEFMILKKEANMDKQEYIKKLAAFLPEDRQKAFLEKTQLKKEALEEAQVESKEVSGDFNYEQVKEQLLKEVDVDGLSEFVKATQEELQKIPILEAAIESLQSANAELQKDSDEKLAEKIAPPAKFPWSQRASQSDETVLKKEDKEDAELEKAAPEVFWLNQQTHTQPLEN